MSQKSTPQEQALRDSLESMVEMLNDYAAMFDRGELPPMLAAEGLRHVASLINLAIIERQDAGG